MLDPYEQFILFLGFYFGFFFFFLFRWPFFRADMAGLGKYHMGGYGQIGDSRVKHVLKVRLTFLWW